MTFVGGRIRAGQTVHDVHPRPHLYLAWWCFACTSECCVRGRERGGGVDHVRAREKRAQPKRGFWILSSVPSQLTAATLTTDRPQNTLTVHSLTHPINPRSHHPYGHSLHSRTHSSRRSLTRLTHPSTHELTHSLTPPHSRTHSLRFAVPSRIRVTRSRSLTHSTHSGRQPHR